MARKRRGSRTRGQKLAMLVADATSHIDALGYSKRVVANYGTTWRSLLRFAQRRRCDRFSKRLAEEFLRSRGVPLGGPIPGSHGRHLRAAMRILGDLARDGQLQRRQSLENPIRLSPPMAAVWTGYLRYGVDRVGYAPATLRQARRVITAFLHMLECRGHRGLGSLAPVDIEAFARSRSHLATTTVGGEMSALRAFLRGGLAVGLLDRDLTADVPRVPWRRYGRLPSVWKPGEIDAMLRVVGRSSPVGKRDYVLLLFACRLGLRAGEIRRLRLDDLSWDEAVVTVRQSKTGRVIELPMTDELAVALIDYLRHGRPASDHREIFVRLKAPFEPYDEGNNFYGILTKYRRRAGIKLERQRRGLHSLRHSMATALLADGTPLEEISPLLGHASTETTEIYTSVDLAALRRAALEPHGATDA